MLVIESSACIHTVAHLLSAAFKAALLMVTGPVGASCLGDKIIRLLLHVGSLSCACRACFKGSSWATAVCRMTEVALQGAVQRRGMQNDGNFCYAISTTQLVSSDA